jgi:hypothetical protein
MFVDRKYVLSKMFEVYLWFHALNAIHRDKGSIPGSAGRLTYSARA